MTPDRKTFFILGLVTLFGFGALGIFIISLFADQPIDALLTFGDDWIYQVVRGSFFGLIAVLNMLWIIRTPILKESREFFANLIKQANLKVPDILFLSFAAGVGEEILFRGAIQHYLGIWLTALVFVSIHGYLNPFNVKMSVYGVLMVFVSAGLGYLFEYVGIFAAITAHFLIDVVLFIRFRYY